ncbi:hypothetical protein BS17DRAFT_772278 [Gyrodon lividus]|nr:hypothetical protein BS17DRAFT_772278 [Gyrodon lividus]
MPAIRGPKALQDAWDPTKTVRQNYLALGLQHTLNPISSGGSEVGPGCTRDKINTSHSPSTAISYDGDRPSGIEDRPTCASELPKGFGRIIRDSSGAVTFVELHEDGEAEQTSKHDIDMDPPMTTESELRIWAQASSEESWRRADSGITDNTIVKELENLAASANERRRHSSVGERSYLERLIKKYGDDLNKMALDRRLNPEQKTVGELKRAVTRAGGLEILRGDTC